MVAEMKKKHILKKPTILVLGMFIQFFWYITETQDNDKKIPLQAVKQRNQHQYLESKKLQVLKTSNTQTSSKSIKYIRERKKIKEPRRQAYNSWKENALEQN